MYISKLISFISSSCLRSDIIVSCLSCISFSNNFIATSISALSEIWKIVLRDGVDKKMILCKKWVTMYVCNMTNVFTCKSSSFCSSTFFFLSSSKAFDGSVSLSCLDFSEVVLLTLRFSWNAYSDMHIVYLLLCTYKHSLCDNAGGRTMVSRIITSGAYQYLFMSDLIVNVIGTIHK